MTRLAISSSAMTIHPLEVAPVRPCEDGSPRAYLRPLSEPLNQPLQGLVTRCRLLCSNIFYVRQTIASTQLEYLPMFVFIAPPSQPMPPPRKQWFDKLADAILGDEDGGSATPASSRYALICQKCFTHNGLVKESMWEDARECCFV